MFGREKKNLYAVIVTLEVTGDVEPIRGSVYEHLLAAFADQKVALAKGWYVDRDYFAEVGGLSEGERDALSPHALLGLKLKLWGRETSVVTACEQVIQKIEAMEGVEGAGFDVQRWTRGHRIEEKTILSD